MTRLKASFPRAAAMRSSSAGEVAVCMCAPPAGPVSSRQACRSRAEGHAVCGALTLRDMIDLSGKAAVVTGGSRGIGRAIVLRLATQGADVAFSYRGNAAAAEATAEEVRALGRTALPVNADVSQPESAETLIKEALDALGKVDILVNNAGITRDDLI